METSARNQFVRPRIRSSDPDASGTLLLEDAIAERLARGETGVVWISGPPGAGKRSALAYLRAYFAGDERVEVDPSTRVVGEAEARLHDAPTLRISGCRKASSKVQALELAPWSRDECIEYLLARHPARCASVMQRIGRAEQPIDLDGVPLLLGAVLDALSADEALLGEFEALRAALVRVFGSENMLGKARSAAFSSLWPGGDHAMHEIKELLPWTDWLRQKPVLLLLAAESIVLLLERHRGKKLPDLAVDTQLLRVVSPLLERSPHAREEAARVLTSGSSGAQPWAASLVHLEGPEALAAAWPPRRILRRGRPRLTGAALAGLRGEGLDLAGVEAIGTEFRDAFLERCDLSEALLRHARFMGATLRGVRLGEADLREADLTQADLEGADAHEARFDGACLDRANLRRADLHGAALEGCSLRGTVAEGADFSGAYLKGLDFRGMQGLPARLAKAGLMGANLEGQSGEALDFSTAELTGALLSGTRFPQANFQHAILRDTGLAWIDWEGANLFDADLTGASFHLGSTRSGLVFNAPAGWGTRTGFYTDEYKEQGFKAPEEIRKANLRRADLRKAKIFETDFYLVDLRDAIYTPDQEKHLRGCGAILGS